MKTTNKHNLPQAIVTAVTNDPYTKGDSDVSVTELISPARIRVLFKKFESELSEDVSDQINILLGQIMHGILERANIQALSEKRFYLEIDGVLVSGSLDAFYENGLLQDYKLVSVYSVKDGAKDDYEKQLNAYAYLVKHGYTKDPGSTFKQFLKLEAEQLELVCILRDWSKNKARQDPTLPQAQCIVLPVDLWTEEAQLEYLKERVATHKAAETQLPECTPEERWAVPDKWAVMPKKGAARSLKNHESKEFAEIHAAQTKGAFVEKRPGANNRCDGYCVVSSVCEQYKKLREANEKTE